jgi:hypothetical protein
MRSTLTALFWLGCALPAASHELWLQPEPAIVAPNEPVAVRIFIGSNFLGEELGNFPSLQDSVDLFIDAQRYKIDSRIGDLPAFTFQPEQAGLHILRYQSVHNVVTYDSYDAYLTFLKEAEREDLAAEHDARGLSRDGITEAFTRYAKGLIAAGEGAGADLFTGMPFELVAVENPYRREGDAVTFALLLGGNPAPDSALHLFIRKADGSIDTSIRLRSDAKGLIEVPSRQPGLYMLNAIHIMPASARINSALGASWHSLWASSTFEIK